MKNSNLPITYTNKYIWTNILLIVAIIFTFTSISKAISIGLSALWFIYLLSSLRTRLQAALPLLFIAACYERPIMDFGVGILATIKLFDVLSIALFLAYLTRNRYVQGAPQRLKIDSTVIALFFLTLLATLSGVALFIEYSSTNFQQVRNTLFYTLKFVQYLAVFAILYSIPQSGFLIKRALNFFLVGLCVAGGVAIMQGLGILPVEYYTSNTGAYSYLYSEWAIGTLGPNHSHIGVYCALGLLIAFTHATHRITLLQFIPIVILLGALYFSHSSVGIGMLVLASAMLFLFVQLEKKLVLLIPAICIFAGLAFYFSGSDNTSTKNVERTKEKFSVSEDSEIIVRAFIRPYESLSSAYKDDITGAIWGFGYRAPDLNSTHLPRTGDNNYFSVIAELGWIGFGLFIWLIISIYRKLMAKRYHFSSPYDMAISRFSMVMLISTVVGMFSQEILWPLHSRGNTMIVMLIILCLPLLIDTSDRTGRTNPDT